MKEEPWAIALEICLSKPMNRGRILANAFPFADIEVFYDNGSSYTEAVVRDKRKHEVILRKTYEALDLTTQGGLFRIASAIVNGLDEYFNEVS